MQGERVGFNKSFIKVYKTYKNQYLCGFSGEFVIYFIMEIDIKFE